MSQIPDVAGHDVGVGWVNRYGLRCTICQQPAFAKLNLEITQGAATYLVCGSSRCIGEACQRAADNLWRAASKLRGVAIPDAIEVTSADSP